MSVQGVTCVACTSLEEADENDVLFKSLKAPESEAINTAIEGLRKRVGEAVSCAKICSAVLLASDGLDLRNRMIGAQSTMKELKVRSNQLPEVVKTTFRSGLDMEFPS